MSSFDDAARKLARVRTTKKRTVNDYRPQPYDSDGEGSGEPVTCPNCGKGDAADAKYCDQCGFKLAGADGVVVNKGADEWAAWREANGGRSGSKAPEGGDLHSAGAVHSALKEAGFQQPDKKLPFFTHPSGATASVFRARDLGARTPVGTRTVIHPGRHVGSGPGFGGPRTFSSRTHSIGQVKDAIGQAASGGWKSADPEVVKGTAEWEAWREGQSGDATRGTAGSPEKDARERAIHSAMGALGSAHLAATAEHTGSQSRSDAVRAGVARAQSALASGTRGGMRDAIKAIRDRSVSGNAAAGLGGRGPQPGDALHHLNDAADLLESHLNSTRVGKSADPGVVKGTAEWEAWKAGHGAKGNTPIHELKQGDLVHTIGGGLGHVVSDARSTGHNSSKFGAQTPNGKQFSVRIQHVLPSGASRSSSTLTSDGFPNGVEHVGHLPNVYGKGPGATGPLSEAHAAYSSSKASKSADWFAGTEPTTADLAKLVTSPDPKVRELARALLAKGTAEWEAWEAGLGSADGGAHAAWAGQENKYTRGESPATRANALVGGASGSREDQARPHLLAADRAATAGDHATAAREYQAAADKVHGDLPPTSNNLATQGGQAKVAMQLAQQAADYHAARA